MALGEGRELGGEEPTNELRLDAGGGCCRRHGRQFDGRAFSGSGARPTGTVQAKATGEAPSERTETCV